MLFSALIPSMQVFTFLILHFTVKVIGVRHLKYDIISKEHLFLGKFRGEKFDTKAISEV